MPTNVIDTCNVVKSPALKSQTNWNKKNWQIRKQGTRVFKHHDKNYCKPSYIHDDGQWAVFFCYEDNRVTEVESILKSYPGQSEIFKTDKYLAELGVFYLLEDYEQFGIDNIDQWPAVKYGNIPINEMHDIKFNNKPWEHPTAEVVQGLAMQMSYLYPDGNKVHVDQYGFPNLSEADPSQLNNKEILLPPNRYGGYNERSILNITANSPKMTNWLVHIHPMGGKPKTVDPCSIIQCGVFTYINQGNEGRSQPCCGPSPSDLLLQHDIEYNERNKFNKHKQKIKICRSVIVSRHYICLYNFGPQDRPESSEMYIRRMTPDLSQD